MTTPDGFVQVPLDGSGKSIETSELTRVNPDGTTTLVERQRFAEADASDISALAGVTRQGERLVTDKSVAETIFAMADDMRQIRLMLEILLNGP